MPRIASLILLITIGATARAADPPNTLTPEETKDGWVLLFDGETTFGWTVEGDVKPGGGSITLIGGEKGAAITTTSPFGRALLRVAYEVGGTKPGVITWRGENLWLGRSSNWAKLEWEPGPKTPPHSPVSIAAPPGTTAIVRAVSIKPAEMTALFNGKDLTGWKVFPGARYKSTFSVTPEGWLNVKNGPGDLQTEKTFADFVFQGECISNGDHLNSGIFFRCMAGRYQDGYEMQIRNQWQGDDRTKPVDFGTGAIYRRVPARKVVSSDREWFTMTLVAHGNHFATWVNGYQVVDWTDTRPENENPRNGLRLKSGHLSIQGHDPTTDLSFRTLRIAELKKE
jgi:Domain of Unknown Function (DUF1080)